MPKSCHVYHGIHVKRDQTIYKHSKSSPIRTAMPISIKIWPISVSSIQFQRGFGQMLGHNKRETNQKFSGINLKQVSQFYCVVSDRFNSNLPVSEDFLLEDLRYALSKKNSRSHTFMTPSNLVQKWIRVGISAQTENVV